jgi:hypothetical protein
LYTKTHKKPRATKKKSGKGLQVIKKSVPLHRFNKAIDCLTKKKDNTMKKLVFMFVAMAAVSFASCGGNENKGAEADSIATDSIETTDSIATDSVAADSVAADSVVEAPVAE